MLGEHFFKEYDFRRAKYWMEKCASHGDTVVENDLAKILLKEGEFYKATMHLLKAYSSGDTESAKYLGFLFENGLGVVQDKQIAREYYKQAKRNGMGKDLME